MDPDFDSQKARSIEQKHASMLHFSDIDYIIKNGEIILTGIVCCYLKKQEAIRLAKKIAGITGIVLDLEEVIEIPDKNKDCEILLAIENALIKNLLVPHRNIIVNVVNGIVDLEGAVDFQYQKNAAASSVESISGITKIYNNIIIKSVIQAEIVKEDIRKALHHKASTGAESIKVEIRDSKIVLKGALHSVHEKNEVEKVVRAIPGVTDVINEITVVH